LVISDAAPAQGPSPYCIGRGQIAGGRVGWETEPYAAVREASGARKQSVTALLMLTEMLNELSVLMRRRFLGTMATDDKGYLSTS